MTTLEQLKKYIVEYQNYEGARVIAKENNISDDQVEKLVGDFFFKIYSMDAKKRFEWKLRRRSSDGSPGFWRDDPRWVKV